MAQTATVTGVDDALDDGDIAYSIVMTLATSADVTYAGLNAIDVAVTNTDNDSGGGVSEVLTGTYVGNGADNRPITGLGFQPDLVIVKATTSRAGCCADVDDDRLTCRNRWEPGTSSPTAFNRWIRPGSRSAPARQVNATGTTYQWVAWKTGAGEMTVGTYTGTGASQSITGLGFSPDIVFVLGDNGDEPVHKVSAVTPATNAFSFAGGDGTDLHHRARSGWIHRWHRHARQPCRRPVSLRGVE